MSERRLLYLDAHGLAAYHWQRGQLAADESFAATEEDLGRFSAYLDCAGKHVVFRILVDVGQEDFRVETIPFLKGRDRQEFISRKNAQFFPGTPFAAAFSLGHETSGRRNERVLLHALTRPADLEPWLTRIGASGAALAGIYTTAQLSTQVLDKIQKRTAGGVLLTQLGDSLRESHVVDGQTLFSRQVPLSDCDASAVAATFASEALRLRQYLLGQRHLDRDQPLSTWALVHPQAVAAVEDTCMNLAGVACTVVDSHLLCGRIGLRTAPRDNRNDAIFLHLLAQSPPRLHLASEAHRHGYRLLQARRALLATGLLAFLTALPLTGKVLYENHSLNLDAERLAADERTLSGQHAEILASLPALPLDHQTLFRVTTRYTELLKQQRQPASAYQLVSRALEAAPAIELGDIEWKTDERGGEEIILHGFLKAGQEIRPRLILQAFEDFTRSLQDRPGTRIEVLHPLLDIDSSTPSESDEKADQTFALRITRPPEP